MESIVFANAEEEEILREILLNSNMDLAGEIQAHVLIKQANEILGGGMLAEIGEDQFHLLVFAISPNDRHKGIGSCLLQQLLKQPWRYCLEEAKAAEGKYIITTVAKGGSANFYKRNGFIPCDFAALTYPFNEQCDECPDKSDCNPAAMMFIGRNNC